ncbi:hypothetical protein WJX73_006595 [Symbiochloris irregularis]|uniref:Uncharacterized protein n=1 Tax=Symbiochloris irregularis TaxID=706552 RepID=A0AAW1PG52_9CHLO
MGPQPTTAAQRSDLEVLRRKLDALCYDDELDERSAALVGNLVEDLIRVTEGYRGQKTQLAQGLQDLDDARVQAKAFRHDANRLTAENNRLHKQALQAAEAADAAAREHYKQAKARDAELAELSFWKQRHTERFRELETANEELKARLLAAEDEEQEVDRGVHGSVDLTVQRAASPQQPTKQDPNEDAKLLAASAHRVQDLEAALQKSGERVQQAQQDLSVAQAGLERRDGEIQRLAGLLERCDASDALALKHRAETHENIILQLHAQVAALTKELAESAKQLREKAPLEASLAKAQAAKEQAERRLREAGQENASIAREVVEMRTSLQRLQAIKVTPSPDIRASAKKHRISFFPSSIHMALNIEVFRAETPLEFLAANAKAAKLAAELAATQAQLAEAAQKSLRLETEALARQTVLTQLQAELGSSQTQVQELGATTRQLQEALQAASIKPLWMTAPAALPNESSGPSQQRPQTAPARDDSLAQRNDSSLADQSLTQTDKSLGLGGARTRNEAVSNLAAELKEAVEGRVQAEKELAEAQVQVTQLSQQVQHLIGQQQEAAPEPDQNERMQDQIEAHKAQSQALHSQIISLQARLTQLQDVNHQLTQRLEEASHGTSRLNEVELDGVRADRDASSAHAAALSQQLEEARSELQKRGQEVEALTQLSLKGESTLRDYVSHLQDTQTQLQAASLRETRMHSDAEGTQAALDHSQQETMRLSKEYAKLQAQYTALQQQLTQQEQAMSMLSEERALALSQGQEASRALQAADARLSSATSALHDSEGRERQLQAQLDAALQNLEALDQERASLQEDLHRLTEDLESLTRENQVIATSLETAREEGTQWQAQARAGGARMSHLEMVLEGREAEIAELRSTCEVMAEDAKRASHAVSQLERELAAAQGHMAAQDSELEGLHDAQRSAQVQINQYVIDLQAFERQVDVLSRQLSRGATDAQGWERERQQLLTDLAMAEQARHEVERHREALQRQMGGLDGQLHVAHARLQDALSDHHALEGKLGLEARRVQELEGVLARLRASQFRTQADGQLAGNRTDALGRRNAQLEDEVASLHSQLMVRERMALLSQQQSQIAELREENERLMELVGTMDRQSLALEVEVARLKSEDSPGTHEH